MYFNRSTKQFFFKYEGFGANTPSIDTSAMSSEAYVCLMVPKKVFRISRRRNQILNSCWVDYPIFRESFKVVTNHRNNQKRIAESLPST